MPRVPNKAQLEAHECVLRAQYWLSEARGFLEHDAASEGITDDLFDIQIELSRVLKDTTWPEQRSQQGLW